MIGDRDAYPQTARELSLRYDHLLKQIRPLAHGTNAVRALLERYVPDVTVLMHMLRDKHSPPVDLDEVVRITAGPLQRTLRCSSCGTSWQCSAARLAGRALPRARR